MAFVVAMLVALAVLWGVAFVAIKETLHWLSPATLTLLRFAIADAALVVLALSWKGARPVVPAGSWPRVVALGVLGIPVYHLAISWGETRTSASVAALVVATAPVMVAALSPLVLRERVGARRAAGIGLAFAGVALLTWKGSAAAGDRPTEALGIAISALSPLAWALYTVVARPILAHVSPMQLTSAVFLTGGVFLLPFLRGSTFDEIAALPAIGWFWITLLGLGSSVAGYVIFNWALARMPASRVAVFIYMVPVAAIVSAWLIRGEPITAWVGLAAALVIGGVVLAQRENARAARAGQPKKTSATSSSS